MKPPLRTKSVGTKVSEAEFALLEERARGAGMRLGEWVREALLSAPAESGPDSGEVALAEVLALRSLLLNLHFGSATIPEAEMRGLIEPHYPKAGNGRPPVGLERMLRIYFLQQWFNLSDPAVEDALYDSLAMR